MFRVLFWTFFLCISSFAVTLHISPDEKVDVTAQDVDAMKQYVKDKFHFIMNENGAKKIVKENRILSNVYLKKGLLTPFEQSVLRIEVEKKLADNLIKKTQKKSILPEKVLKSYYYDHLQDFRKPDEIEVIRYRFGNFADAYKFYQGDKNVSYKKENLGWRYVSSIKRPFNEFIVKNKKNYYTPPFVLGKQDIDVYYIADYKENKENYFPYEKVKSRIERIIYARTFERDRRKYLEKISESQNH